MTDESPESPVPSQPAEGDAAYQDFQERTDTDAANQEEGEEAHGGQGAEQSGPAGDAQAGSGTVGIGGYDDREAGSDMPRMPSVPETQDDDTTPGDDGEFQKK